MRVSPSLGADGKDAAHDSGLCLLHDTAHEASAVTLVAVGWYNPRRRHSALDYLSPMIFEWTHGIGDRTVVRGSTIDQGGAISVSPRRCCSDDRESRSPSTQPGNSSATAAGQSRNAGCVRVWAWNSYLNDPFRWLTCHHEPAAFSPPQAARHRRPRSRAMRVVIVLPEGSLRSCG
jgi:hypothetical protein